MFCTQLNTNFGVRKYDDAVGRFTSIDPLFEKYAGWTPYQYCANNPIGYKDENGKNYILDIDNQQQTLHVTVPIFLSGPDANSQSQLYISKGVDEYWNNNGAGWQVNVDGNNYQLNISADVVIGAPSGNISDNSYYTDNKLDRSHVTNNESGVGTSNSWSVIHENGHFLGLTDRYSDKQNYILGIIPNGKESVPNKGWENNIMGQYNGVVDQRNILSFIKILTPYISGSKNINASIEINASQNKEKK